MLNKIHGDKNPKYIIITPLKIGDKISSDTKVTVKRNKLPFVWYSFEGDGNVVENYQNGLNKVLGKYKNVSYCIKVDGDTVWNRNSLDNMYYTLEKSGKKVAYSYCGFEFVGGVNHKFPPTPFNPDRLKQSNYISSNSMFKISVLKEIPMITDNQYKRLLDWVYYLHLLNNGYIGELTKGFFVTITKKDSISAGSKEDYIEKYNRVKKDFIEIVDKKGE